MQRVDVRENRSQILRAMKDADDLDYVGEDSVEDDKVVGYEIAKIGRDVRSGRAEEGMLGKAGYLLVEGVEYAVCCGRVILGDVLPDREEILPSCNGERDSGHGKIRRGSTGESHRARFAFDLGDIQWAGRPTGETDLPETAQVFDLLLLGYPLELPVAQGLTDDLARGGLW